MENEHKYFKGKPEKIMSFKEHQESDELSEFNVMKSPVVLLGLMATLHRKIESKEDKALAKMIWLSAQMSFSFMGSLEKQINEMSEQIKRLS